VALAASGVVDTVVLECLAERTIVPGLRAQRANPEAGQDPRLKRRLSPLLPVAVKNKCRIISNLGAANAAAAGRAIGRLAKDLGCQGLRIAAVTGDDMMPLKDQITWNETFNGELLGARAYLGMDGITEAIKGGADVVVTGRVADSALFAADLVPHLDSGEAALANAIAVGHLLECAGHLTGGNYEHPGGGGLSAEDFANLGYPLARVNAAGSAEIGVLDNAPAILNVLNCTLQLLYEVHDPAAYITPDAILDFTGVRFTQVGPTRVHMTGARMKGKPTHLKVSGFVEYDGTIADVELGFAGKGAYDRARVAAETLRHRLSDWRPEDIRIDIVGADSILGGASTPPSAPPPEVRVHISARCDDLDAAQIIEDEVIALTVAGPAGGGSIRSERRPRVEVISGLIPRERVVTQLEWTTA
jgi:hypothetical protein